MKKLLIIPFLFLSLSLSAVKHYVATGGGGAGTLVSPFATIAQVNAHSFVAGDSVLFNRGDTWREQLIPNSGSVSGYVYYGAYGTGAKPKLLGSVTANSGWSNISGNIWQNSNAAFTVDVGNLIFNAEASCGIKQMAASPTLDTQGDFWYDFVNDRIRMYSVGDPAVFYTNIECALYNYIINISSISYVIIQNLDLKYSGGWGIVGTNTDHIIIEDCDLSYIGGCDQNGDYGTRAGNGIEFSNNSSNNLVQRCKLDNIFDGALDVEIVTSGRAASNIHLNYNIITNSEAGLCLLNGTAGSGVSNIYYENNTCINAGGGWGHNQRPDEYGCHILMFTQRGTASNVFFRNNICKTATRSPIWIMNLVDLAGIVFDYNDFYQASGDIAQVGFGTQVSYTTLASWRAASSQDANSISADPAFVSSSDYNLQVTSPAKNAGVDVGLTTDYLGNAIIGNPDIGAYEYGYTTPPLIKTVTHNGHTVTHNGNTVTH